MPGKGSAPINHQLTHTKQDSPGAVAYAYRSLTLKKRQQHLIAVLYNQARYLIWEFMITHAHTPPILEYIPTTVKD